MNSIPSALAIPPIIVTTAANAVRTATYVPLGGVEKLAPKKSGGIPKAHSSGPFTPSQRTQSTGRPTAPNCVQPDPAWCQALLRHPLENVPPAKRAL
jgi:hypothetical protein